MRTFSASHRPSIISTVRPARAMPPTTHHHMTDLNRLIRSWIVWAALFREYFAAGEKRFRGAFYRADATDREPGKAGII